MLKRKNKVSSGDRRCMCGLREHAAAAAAAKSFQSCLSLCDPIEGSPPGSSVPGILQVRILEWVAISFSRNEVYLGLILNSTESKDVHILC